MILQTRSDRQKSCPFAFTERFHDYLWTSAAAQCGAVHNCEVFGSSSLNLYACNADEPPEEFFGKAAGSMAAGHFDELLQSIADAQLLVRYDATMGRNLMYSTADYIDAQTSSATVLFVFFSLPSGIITILEVNVVFDLTPKLTRTITHLNAKQGTWNVVYLTLCCVTIFTCLLTGIKILLKLTMPWRFGRYHHSLFVGAVDLAVMCIFPVVYLSMMASHSTSSERELVEVAATMVAVPWESSGVSPSDKAAAYALAVTGLRAAIEHQGRLLAAGVVLGVLLLLRLMFATDMHPRIGVLVRTMVHAARDLFHFFLLVVVLYSSSMLLAYASFGGTRYEFASVSQSMKTLIDVTLGSLPSDVFDEPALALFLLLFLLVNFFVILNFMIAIILDAYAAVTADMNNLTNRSLVRDVMLCLSAERKRFTYRWPSHVEAIKALKGSNRTAVTFNAATELFPSRSHEALQRWLEHFSAVSEHLHHTVAKQDADRVDLVQSRASLRDLVHR